MIYNEDCISGAKKYIKDKSVDLIICDPPFGIEGHLLHKHYNRNENLVISGYQEAPANYYDFSYQWIQQAKRILKDSGSMYIVSGWSNLHHVLNAVFANNLYLINHIIWKFNFGPATKNKYVSSHYHILYLKKDKKTKVKFNNRFESGSKRYKDLEDVLIINKQYMPGTVKNKNKLPDELVRKMISYSSSEGEKVCDFFLGNFTSARVSQEMGRIPMGFEINKESYEAIFMASSVQYNMPTIS